MFGDNCLEIILKIWRVQLVNQVGGFDCPLKQHNKNQVIFKIWRVQWVNRVGDLIPHSNWVTLIW
jgi:hypothetical protein